MHLVLMKAHFCTLVALSLVLLHGDGVDAHGNYTRPSNYPVDTAKVIVTASSVPHTDISTYDLWGIDDNCFECLKLPILYNIAKTLSNEEVLQIETEFPFNFQVRENKTQDILLSFSYHFGDRGVYLVTFSWVNNTWEAKVEELLGGYNLLEPIWVALGVFAFMAIVYAGTIIGIRRYRDKDNSSTDTKVNSDPGEQISLISKAGTTPKGSRPVSSGRLSSLDTFRGIAIVIMMFVNYGGGGYWFFDHSKWNGLTFADLVFPWFIWIMGTAMALSFKSLETKKTPMSEILYKVFRRFVILFALGLFLNNGYYLYSWRIPGVLQRFAVSYLAVSFIILFVPEIQKFDNPESILGDILPYLFQWAFAACLVIVHLCITFLLDVPGCGRGYIGPGGIGEYGKFQNCTGGAAGYIDKLVFGENHIYQTPTCQELYHTGPYDPEGLLGCLTSIFLCFVGLQSGRIIVKYKDHAQRLIRWLMWGVLFCLIGGILCKFSKNDGWIPLNKNLWSVSFVCTMAGTAFLLLALCYLVVDVKNWWNGSPFRFVGMNSILIYCLHEVFDGYFPFHVYELSHLTATHAQLLVGNIIGVGCWVIVAYRMYQLDFFVSI